MISLLRELTLRVGEILDNQVSASVMASLTGRDSLFTSLSVAGV